MITTPEQLERIDQTFDAAKEICRALAPLTGRAQQRLLVYFQDLVTDPEGDGSFHELEILKQVRLHLAGSKRKELSAV